MKLNKTGFTLIELLVVVLIIGILAAIAVPQYQKAAFKSKTVQAYIALKALAAAQEQYFLIHGKHTTRFQDLDISMGTACTGSSCAIGQYTYYIWPYIIAVYFGKFPGAPLSLSYFYDNPDSTSQYFGAPYNAKKGDYMCKGIDASWDTTCKTIAGDNYRNISTVYLWR